MIKLLSYIWIVRFLFHICFGSLDLPFKDDNQKEFIRSVPSYEVVNPVRVSRSSNYLSDLASYSVSPEEISESDQFLKRKKRYTPYYHTSRSYYHDGIPFYQLFLENDPTVVHYQLLIENVLYHLDLVLNRALISPSLVITKNATGFDENGLFKNEDILQRSSEVYKADRCHFLGKVRGLVNSKVALATCEGLHGFIDLGTEDNHFFIEPMMVIIKSSGFNLRENSSNLLYIKKDNLSQSFEKYTNELDNDSIKPFHPHLIYKRSALNLNKEQQAVDTIEKRFRRFKNNNEKRKKRSVVMLKKVEMLVVADSTFQYFHSYQDINNYILTQMNMVAGLYHDASIGNAIDISVVRIILLKGNEFNSNAHATNTLISFCKWQNDINPKGDDNPYHHDSAVLLTRRKMCQNSESDCGTIGLAPQFGMCKPDESCSICYDSGIMLSNTIAHEIGHTFGMDHDAQQNNCYNGPNFVMSPSINKVPGPFVWSDCSKNIISNFIDKGKGFCLDDEPSSVDHVYPSKLPGVLYNINDQCRLMHGEASTFCGSLDENLCRVVYCYNDYRQCVTKQFPAAEGTKCGEGQWCYNSECIGEGDRPLAIDGKWGMWSSWSTCSRTCGGGVSYSQRHCDNPQPQHSGQYCIGERKRYTICETNSCPSNQLNYRQLQCTWKNNIPFQGATYNWEPYFAEDNLCQLTCKQSNSNIYVALEPTVEDGTPCNEYSQSKNICISGICKIVGCDWKLGSEAIDDKCGVCKGDGKTCKEVKTQFTKDMGRDYEFMANLPIKARNIKIKMREKDTNFIAVRSATNKKNYYLNGNKTLSSEGKNIIAGTILSYKKTENGEIVTMEGPITEALVVELLMFRENHGIDVSYTISKTAKEIEDSKISAKWFTTNWRACSTTCSSPDNLGTQKRTLYCAKVKGKILDRILCSGQNPPETVQKCMNQKLC